MNEASNNVSSNTNPSDSSNSVTFREHADLRVHIAENYSTKEELEKAKNDLIDRIKDVKHWIWYAVIPLGLTILGLALKIIFE